MLHKTCTKCKIKKLLAEFSKQLTAKDELQHRCKSCTATYGREYRQSHKEEIAAYQRNYLQTSRGREAHRKGVKKCQQTLRGKEAHRRGAKKYRQEYPEQLIARNAVNNAIQAGKIERPWYCEFCFITCQPEAHHEDYSKPLEVDWLCLKCHNKLHEELRRKE